MMSALVLRTCWTCGSLWLVCTLATGLAIQREHALSDETHFDADGQHNRQFDREAFLGESDARDFEHLSPDESRARLALIVDRIDADGDALVSHEELNQWIRRSQKKYIMDDVDRQWKSQTDGDASVAKLEWRDYRQRTFGFLDSGASADAAYEDMQRRDERRWRRADRDADGALTKAEFVDFLHPEEAAHMRDVVVDETLEDIDKDKDGRVSVDEYISDMYAPDAAGDQLPDWVLREKEQFQLYRDKNKDGFMDRDEIGDWIIPPDYDHAHAEAKHLIAEADKDKDGQLSKEEILDNYDLFVGSQATDFGEALMRSHDEF